MLDPFTKLLHDSAGHHGPLALMYHSVQKVRGTPSWPWAVSLGQLEEHLDLLAREGWTTCALSELSTQTGQNAKGRTVAITFDDGFEDNLAALEALVRRGMRASWFVVTGSIGKAPGWPDAGRPTGRILNASELRNMVDLGMEVGSHGHTHSRLPGLSQARVANELTGSRKMLEDILGRRILSFSYPYGDWDDQCEAAVARAGYVTACTTRTGVATRDANPLRIRRLTVFNHDKAAHLARKLALAANDGDWRSALTYVMGRARTQLKSKA